MPVTFSVMVGPAGDGTDRYLATVGDSDDDVVGARAGTAEAAALRAVSLYLKLHDPSAPDTPTTEHPADAFAQRKPRVAVGPLSIREIIEDAIRNDTEVEITYRDSNNVETVRKVEPFQFKEGRESELIECFDDLRGQVRNFRLDRISRVESK